MQDRYAGDVGDFAKYGLLRAMTDAELARRPGLVWFLVPDERHNEDGRFTEYLAERHEPRFRPCDPALYDELRALIGRGVRSVEAVRRAKVLPPSTASFHERLMYPPADSATAVRDRWLQDALVATADCDLVFFDPDNGVASDSMRPGRSDLKHVFIEDLAAFYAREQSLVVYHHFGRQGSHEAQARQLQVRLAVGLGLTTPPVILRWTAFSARAFAVVPSPERVDVVSHFVSAFRESPWGQHFTSANT